MKKLKLNIEEIKIESFQTVPAPKEKGTVYAQDSIVFIWNCDHLLSKGDYLTYCQMQCPSYYTCGANPTCYETCNPIMQTCDNQCMITLDGGVTCDTCQDPQGIGDCTAVTFNMCGPRCS